MMWRIAAARNNPCFGENQENFEWKFHDIIYTAFENTDLFNNMIKLTRNESNMQSQQYQSISIIDVLYVFIKLCKVRVDLFL